MSGSIDSAEDSDQPASDTDKPPEPDVEVAAAPGTRDGQVDLDQLRNRIAEVIAHVDARIRRVAVTLVGDRRMRDLNRTHLDRDGTTDVLAFDNADTGAPIDADIAVCVEVAARRAAELGHPIEQELLLYALHGVLHCAGFEDKTTEGFEAMHAEEDRILSLIGVGLIFARDRGGAGS